MYCSPYRFWACIGCFYRAGASRPGDCGQNGSAGWIRSLGRKLAIQCRGVRIRGYGWRTLRLVWHRCGVLSYAIQVSFVGVVGRVHRLSGNSGIGMGKL